MEVRRDVFQAIADPTRREIIGLISHERLNLNAVADHFEVSRPAISKHVKILEECGLIRVEQDGRERWCVAKVEKLEEVSDWINAIRDVWENRLDQLDQYLIEMKKNKNQKNQ